MIVRREYDTLPPITREQLSMLKKAEQTPFVYDEDNPPLTREQLKQFRRVSDIRKAN